MSAEETEHYEIQRISDGALIMSFTGPTDALKFVLAQDPAAVNRMRLLRRTDDGDWIEVAEGAALYALAKSERGAPPQHRVLIYSNPVRGRDATDVAVNLLKRVFLEGQLQLISIEVLRQTEEDSDDWDNVLVSEQTGDLWMQAVERFRAERKAAREAGDDADDDGKEPS